MNPPTNCAMLKTSDFVTECPMSERPLSVGISTNDRVLPLLLGDIVPAGARLAFTQGKPGEIFWRALHDGEFDVTEMSLAAHCILTSRGENPFVGLPVFTSRMFRHGSLFVRNDAGIARPEDLKGKRIGVPEYQMTAAVWMRGILADDYDLAPSELSWFTGGVNRAGRKERIPLRLPSDQHVRAIAPTDTLDQMLAASELDAIISPEIPAGFLSQRPTMRRLFQDVRATEEAYFQRTAIFPIMHLLVVRRSVLQSDPNLARNLYDAFNEAKALALSRLYDADALYATLPWLIPELERVQALMGYDFWPYGLSKNHHVLKTFLSYLHEQQLLQRPVSVDDLFASATLAT